MTDATAALAAAPGRPLRVGSVSDTRELAVVVYHYVLEPSRSRFPRLKGISADAFGEQVRQLSERFEMASLESAIAFLDGRYAPSRSLCLLTFDDGLREHYEVVTPALVAAGIQGVFFVTTECFEGRVTAVHQNHCLMASVEFAAYRREFVARVSELAPTLTLEVDSEVARRAYPWDAVDVAEFKFLLNYQLPRALQTQVVGELFAAMVGDEASIARDLYLTWDDAREMQRHGMVIGGHTHAHPPLSLVSAERQRTEIETCAGHLRAQLREQQALPFSYPYGYFNDATIDLLRAAGFGCGFALDGGANTAGADRYRIRRIDTKDLVF